MGRRLCDCRVGYLDTDREPLMHRDIPVIGTLVFALVALMLLGIVYDLKTQLDDARREAMPKPIGCDVGYCK